MSRTPIERLRLRWGEGTRNPPRQSFWLVLACGTVALAFIVAAAQALA